MHLRYRFEITWLGQSEIWIGDVGYGRAAINALRESRIQVAIMRPVASTVLRLAAAPKATPGATQVWSAVGPGRRWVCLPWRGIGGAENMGDPMNSPMVSA